MLDPRVVKAVVNHPLLFTKQCMANKEDTRPIRVRYLAVFTPKYNSRKSSNNGESES